MRGDAGGDDDDVRSCRMSDGGGGVVCSRRTCDGGGGGEHEGEMVEIGLGLDRCEVAEFSSTLSEPSCPSAVGSLLCLVQVRSEEAYIR